MNNETTNLSDPLKSLSDIKSVTDSQSSNINLNSKKNLKSNNFKGKINLSKINLDVKEKIRSNLYHNKSSEPKRRQIDRMNLSMLDEKDKHALQNCSRGETVTEENVLKARLACRKLLKGGMKGRSLGEEFEIMKLV